MAQTRTPRDANDVASHFRSNDDQTLFDATILGKARTVVVSAEAIEDHAVRIGNRIPETAGARINYVANNAALFLRIATQKLESGNINAGKIQIFTVDLNPS